MPLVPKVAICFAFPMQCIINVCSKYNEVYTSCMHCSFMLKKRLRQGLRPGPALPQEAQLRSRLSDSIFGSLSLSLPLPTPISGYHYVKVNSINKRPLSRPSQSDSIWQSMHSGCNFYCFGHREKHNLAPN